MTIQQKAEAFISSSAPSLRIKSVESAFASIPRPRREVLSNVVKSIGTASAAIGTKLSALAQREESLTATVKVTDGNLDLSLNNDKPNNTITYILIGAIIFFVSKSMKIF